MTHLSILAAVCATLIGLINPVSSYPHGKTYHVNPCAGTPIQDTINKAHGGDKIIVEAGTYAEQLTISTDGITLIGRNAMLVPPPSPVTNTCSGLAGINATVVTQAGICVTGSDIVFSNDTFDGEHVKVELVGQRVKNTYIKGFTVTGFLGIDIAILGAQDAIVTGNTVSSGAQYGILTVGSKNSNIKHNTAITVGVAPAPFFYFIGICMDDVSTVTIAHNDISGYVIGLCVQTAGAHIHDNNVHNVCVGAFVDPGITGAKLHDNTFSNTNPICPSSFVGGVLISGGINTVVRNNTFSGIKNAGLADAVRIVDDDTKGVVASGNDVEKNTFSNNDLDIYEQTNGTGNVVKKNACTSSFPASLCP
jgi:parallel beta-helix repeat protein